MRVSQRLAEWFHPRGQDLEDRNFESGLARFLAAEGLLETPDDLTSDRFLRRSVAPHVERLSKIFNRLDDKDKVRGVDRYWSSGSNPDHLRLAYFLSFFPPNAMRAAAVWDELLRYGLNLTRDRPLRLTEWGAGPGSGAYGLSLAEGLSPQGKRKWNVTLVEQDRKMLQMGVRWLQVAGGLTAQGLHWKVDLDHGFTDALPASARVKSDVFLSSFFLNEFHASPAQVAQILAREWDQWLEPGGIAILIEPALKAQSRRLLETRAELLKLWESRKSPRSKLGADYSILLPCLGSQVCGALANPEDWCHEEVTWWRPEITTRLDRMTGLNRKTLPFSYLVIRKGSESLESSFPALPVTAQDSHARHRLVSPAHGTGPKRAHRFDYFVCGPKGKFKVHARHKEEPPERGDIVSLPLPGDSDSDS